MRKLALIAGFVFGFFLVELLIFNLVGRLFIPNLLLLLIVSFSIFFGIRYGLFTAVLAGVLRDSFSTDHFGLHIFTFILCAFATILLKRYIYHRGSPFSFFLLTFLISLINIVTQFVLGIMLGQIDFYQMIRFVLIPEVVSTIVIANFVFYQLRTCVLKLFV